MQRQTAPKGNTASATLKGIAMLAAVEAGMVPRAQTADGYNIAPFLRFWEAFSPALDKAFKDAQDIRQVFDEES